MFFSWMEDTEKVASVLFAPFVLVMLEVKTNHLHVFSVVKNAE